MQVDKITFKGQLQEASCQWIVGAFKAHLNYGIKDALSHWLSNRQASCSLSQEDVQAQVDTAVQAAETRAKVQQDQMNQSFEAQLSALQQEIGGEADRGLKEVIYSIPSLVILYAMATRYLPLPLYSSATGSNECYSRRLQGWQR